jgi:anti-sigma regulatory factor (Ser/Thr protein kinase)
LNSTQPAKLVLCLTNPNLSQELDSLQKWLNETAKRLDLSDRTLLELDLVLNEVVPNMISHAYVEQENRDITLSLKENCEFVLLEIIDHGIPFNPFAQKDFENAISLETAAIGGRGIHLIKSFTVAQEYQRIGHFNLTKLSFSKS